MVLAENLPSGLASFLSRLAWHRLLLGSHYIPRWCQEPGFSGTRLGSQPVPGELLWGRAGARIGCEQQARSRQIPCPPALSSPCPQCSPGPFLLPFHHMQVCGFIRGPRKGALSVGNTVPQSLPGSVLPALSERGGSFRDSLNSEFWGNPNILESALVAGSPVFLKKL